MPIQYVKAGFGSKGGGTEIFMKKQERHRVIRDLIETANIETQEDLARALEEKGIRVTQATVSRDIKELRLIKIPGHQSTYCYARPGKHESAVNERMIRLLSDSTVSISYAGQIIVVKTLSGSANVACEAIDNMNWKEVLGTIAGDNTIFLVVRNETDAAEIAARIGKLTGKE